MTHTHATNITSVLETLIKLTKKFNCINAVLIHFINIIMNGKINENFQNQNNDTIIRLCACHLN